MTVINLVESQPHVMIQTHDGDAHVVPVSTFREIAKGTYPSSNLGEPVLRRIIEEWLKFTTETRT